MRIIHGGRGSGLADEPKPEGLVRGEGRRQDLQCDLAVEAFIMRAEHDSHSARADLFLKDVPGDA